MSAREGRGRKKKKCSDSSRGAWGSKNSSSSSSSSDPTKASKASTRHNNNNNPLLLLIQLFLRVSSLGVTPPGETGVSLVGPQVGSQPTLLLLLLPQEDEVFFFFFPSTHKTENLTSLNFLLRRQNCKKKSVAATY